MSSSTNEFIVGCLVGGILGAATAILVDKKIFNGSMPVSRRGTRKQSNENVSRTSSPHHAKSTAHSNDNPEEAAKVVRTRKAPLRKVAKHA